MKPIRLAANRFPRCYRGGPATDGLTRLEDGRTLRGAIQADPVGSLGQRHADADGHGPVRPGVERLLPTPPGAS